MLSKKSYYALKALLILAQEKASADRPILIKTLIEKGKFPRKFLEAILVDIKQIGILKSKMGKGGGYYFTKPLSEIRLGAVVRQFDGPLALLPCVSKMAFERCSHCIDERHCGIRSVFQKVRDQTAALLDNTSLQEVLDDEAALHQLYPAAHAYEI